MTICASSENGPRGVTFPQVVTRKSPLKTCTYPSVASLYRALAEAEGATVDDELPLRPKPVRIRRPGEPLTADEIDLRDRLQSQPHPSAEMR